MKKNFQFLICVFYFWFLVFGFSFAQADHVPGEVLVQFKPSVIGISIKTFSAAPKEANIRVSSVKTLAEKFGITAFSKIYQQTLKDRPDLTELADYYKLTFPKERNVLEAVEEFKKDPNVIHAQPNFIYHAFLTPHDPKYYLQWGLPTIEANKAWDISTGTSETIVAVLDTGVNYNHEDLSGKVLLGADTVEDDGNPMDDQGHGTTVGGVIGAITNNGKGVAGTSWHTKILAVKVLGSDATGVESDIVAGIKWAKTYGGADILNMSFGGTSEALGTFLENDINEAFYAGIVLVAAAGNDGTSTKNYPAALPNVIAVAATDSNDQRSIWTNGKASNYGSWVDVAAPGTNIYTTTYNSNSSYGYSSGTSLACPFVAGLAALIKAKYPSLSNTKIRSLIEDNVDSISTDQYIGKGRINAYKALGALTAQITSPTAESYITGTVEIKGSATGTDFTKYKLGVSTAGSFESLLESTSSVEANILATWNTSGKNGSYTIILTVEASTPATQEATVNVIVDNIPPVAEISSPLNGASPQGLTPILGTAKDENLKFYVLEYGKDVNPSSFEQIGSYTSSVESNSLGSWETTGLSGSYTLRLRVVDKVGLSSSESVVLNVSGVAVGAKSASAVTSGPNPFNPGPGKEFHFSYYLDYNFATTIYVFDLTGNLIWQNSYPPGDNGGKAYPALNAPSWNGQDQFGNTISNGVYFYQVVADRKVIGRGKIIVLK